MSKRILISTGGSGGHVMPATIFYEHLKDKFHVSLSTDNRGIKFLDKNRYNLEIFNINPISQNIFLLPFQFFLIIYLIIKSIFFLKKKNIDILISTGGYMSLPLCLASKILNIKIFLFEPNMVIGRSNKFFIKSCEKIFCYSSIIKNLPKKYINKISIIPALLRKKFYDVKKADGIDKKINLLIIGGSQGAKIFDTLIKSSIIELSKKYSLKIYQQSNSANLEILKKFYKDKNINFELFDFNRDISSLMSKSNICITRAGASTLAELVFINLPFVAIPLPTSKDNHQFENAFFYNKVGCNWILNQNEINDETLENKLFNIIDNKDEFLVKKINMKNFSYQNTWNNINQKIISVINENRISKN
ncbi:UDP-N-acetylglucosamine--N-acetylmuramyl-(pentapeptide) pyrophosphoryl-undecaprenol N-acetylglucosamine transferase [Candidatus Pelagibacter sp.]|nr:UDP-N-acetylglucosamine--N-acetylmuramyl-(pentapeptide) pyrophosphoryl-undecaprenol N-acetylglucosamine transferase [Candidatus Pelagibacter sp.]